MTRVSGRDNGRTIIPSLLLGFLLVSLAMASVGCLPGGGSSGDATENPVLAPDFSGTTLDGQEVSLGGYEGQVLVLVFMASWCGPCREESPEIEQFYQDNQDRAALLAVAVSDPAEDIETFMTENGLTFPVMLDGDEAAGDYGVSGIPTTVVIDAQGYIVKRIIGPTTAAELSSVIDGITP